jgi:enoyl-CoA hydratase
VALTVEVDDAIATVTLNRPEVRNALSGELSAALDDAVVGLDQRDDVAVTILTGADPAFCAGFDLRRLSSELGSVSERRRQGTVDHLGLLPVRRKPVIAAVNGAAVTGGLELALSCDFIVASQRARFADTHARVGAMPGGGLTIRLPQLIGIDRARRMSFTGDFVDAATAYEWGLVTEVVNHDALLPRCREIARSIASIPVRNVAEVRAMYFEAESEPGPVAWRNEMRRCREWMLEQFDHDRLDTERQAIIERGRRQG